MPITTSELAWMQALLDEYYTLAADVTEQHGAYFLRNDEAPRHHDANQVRHIRHIEDLDAFFTAVESHYADRAFRTLRTDWFTPPAVEARLLLEGYETGAEIVMAAAEPPRGHPAVVDIRVLPADSPELETLVRAEHGADSTEPLTLIRRRGSAFTWHIAFADGRPIGHLSQRTTGALGYLESLFVLPEHRMRGVGTALLQHADTTSRAAGATLTFLPTWSADTPRHMYAKLGFEPVFAFRHWLKSG